MSQGAISSFCHEFDRTFLEMGLYNISISSAVFQSLKIFGRLVDFENELCSERKRLEILGYNVVDVLFLIRVFSLSKRGKNRALLQLQGLTNTLT